jgi:hypothetical protein
VKGLQLYVTGSNRTSADSFTLDVNGASTALSVTLTASVTGFYADTTNSVDVAIDSDVCYKLIVPTNSGTLTFSIIGSEFTTTGGMSNVNSSAAGAAVLLSTGTFYFFLGGTSGSSTTESDRQWKATMPFVLKNLRVKKSGGTTVVTVRLNGVDTLLSTTATSTALFENTTDTVVVNRGDLVNYKYVQTVSSGIPVYTVAVDVVPQEGGSSSMFLMF